MAVSAEYTIRSKFEILHRLWWRLHVSEKFSIGTIYPKQTNKQTNNKNKSDGTGKVWDSAGKVWIWSSYLELTQTLLYSSWA